MSFREVTSFLMRGTRTANVATTMNSGQPHVMPVWFLLDGEELVFTTGAGSVKARNLRRDPRIALVVDEDVAPYAFVHIRGRARISEDTGELLRFATEIGGPRRTAGAGDDRAHHCRDRRRRILTTLAATIGRCARPKVSSTTVGQQGE
jgi:PPOX class probable F420-dependent enzyme